MIISNLCPSQALCFFLCCVNHYHTCYSGIVFSIVYFLDTSAFSFAVHGVIHGLSAWRSPSLYPWDPPLPIGPLQVQWQLQEQILRQLLQGCLGGCHFTHRHSCSDLYLPAHWVCRALFAHVMSCGDPTSVGSIVQLFCSKAVNPVFTLGLAHELSALLPRCPFLSFITLQGMPAHCAYM